MHNSRNTKNGRGTGSLFPIFLITKKNPGPTLPLNAAETCLSLSPHKSGQVYDHLNEITLDFMNKMAIGQISSDRTDDGHIDNRRSQHFRHGGALARGPQGACRHRGRSQAPLPFMWRPWSASSVTWWRESKTQTPASRSRKPCSSWHWPKCRRAPPHRPRVDRRQVGRNPRAARSRRRK